MPFVLAAYEIDRTFGGTEEGGWYYDCGQLVRVLKTYPTWDQARAAASRHNALLDRLQRAHRPIHSVLYAGGRHAIHVYRDRPPDHFPEVRPVYS